MSRSRFPRAIAVRTLLLIGNRGPGLGLAACVAAGPDSGLRLAIFGDRPLAGNGDLTVLLAGGVEMLRVGTRERNHVRQRATRYLALFAIELAGEFDQRRLSMGPYALRRVMEHATVLRSPRDGSALGRGA